MKRKNKIRMRGAGKSGKQGRIYRRHNPAVLTGKFFSTSVGGVFFEEGVNGSLEEEKYFIDIPDTMGAINGDTVKVKLLPGKNDAEVKEILDHSVKTVIGTFVRESINTEKCFVNPDDSKLRFTVIVTGSKCSKELSSGDKVEVRLTDYPRFFGDDAKGIITENFGDSCTREANYSAILHETGIITKFSEEAERQAGDSEHDIPVALGRADLRSNTIFTIDGADAKDLDDAISVGRTEDGYILGVHIADVSHYVTKDTPLDKEAMDRGTSVYFSDKVVPMLPVALSNGICSLNAGVDRYAFSVIIELDKFGEIKKATPLKSIINSKLRGVYSEINAVISGDADDNLKEKYSVITDGTLELALEIYEVLKRKSENRGALELESPEGKVLLGEDGEPVDIVRRERGISEKLIEQFMLCANEAVAVYLTSKGYPCVYRVHEKPDKDKVMSFVRFAHNLDLNPPYYKIDSISPGYFGGILERAREKNISFPVSYMLLRTMQKAKYSRINSGHFGLSSKCYCHFTSPIRRYPDLAVHRILSAALEESGAEVTRKYAAFAEKAAEKSSEAELRALDAEREIDALYKTIYMGKHIGEEFDAVVSSVTSFGLFCMLENTCEGMVPLSSMKNRYRYDKESMTLFSPGKTYRLGDNVRIKVEKADVSLRRVDFTLTDEPSGTDIAPDTVYWVKKKSRNGKAVL